MRADERHELRDVLFIARDDPRFLARRLTLAAAVRIGHGLHVINHARFGAWLVHAVSLPAFGCLELRNGRSTSTTEINRNRPFETHNSCRRVGRPALCRATGGSDGLNLLLFYKLPHGC